MALQSSGAIKLSEIQTEFGGDNPIGISEYYRNGIYVARNNTGVPAESTISFSDFYGSTSEFTITLTANRSTPTNLRTLAVNAGWDQRDFLKVINNAILSSNTTATAALTIAGDFPNGVMLINNGAIMGMGGQGGDTLQAGKPGGPAIYVTSDVTIDNPGGIAGGGGGGGAGVYWAWNGYNRSMAGSGGASGLTAALGGVLPSQLGGRAYSSRDNDADSLHETGGPSYNWGWGGRLSSPGGVGGSWGANGDAGGTVDGNYNKSGYAGGAGGQAVSGNSYVTWVATGTRYGDLIE